MSELETIPTLRQKTKAGLKEILKAQDTREVTAFLSSQFIGFLVFMSLRQIFPIYLQKSTGISEAETIIKWGIIVAAYTFGGIITRIPSGYLIEKIGRRSMIISSYIIMTLAVGGLAFAQNTVLLALLFIMLRSSNNIFGLTSRSLLSDIETKYKGFYNSIISTSGRFGSLIGIISLGILLDFFRPIIMLVFVFVFSIVGIVLFQLIFIKGRGEKKHLERRLNLKNGERTKLKRKEILNRVFIFFFIAFTIFGIMEGFTNPQFSLYGYNVINLSESVVGTIIGLSNISFVIVGPIVGLVITFRKKIINLMLLIACTLISVNYLLIYLMPNSMIMYIIFLFVRSAGHALFFPVVMTILTSELSKEHFSFLFSTITTAFFLGLAATSYASGVLLNMNISYFWLSSLISSIVVTILITMYFLFNQRKEKAKKETSIDFAGLK
ncbi:MAG: MFS transporter [Candidatus Heimdallarchaeota archaeon]|nr:MFS transporter [Candidatus Heimdallarchaeota archaeon]MCK4955189.1 MFS transporter [Candidatus Heimdallarchaeota archaeon]